MNSFLATWRLVYCLWTQITVCVCLSYCLTGLNKPSLILSEDQCAQDEDTHIHIWYKHTNQYTQSHTEWFTWTSQVSVTLCDLYYMYMCTFNKSIHFRINDHPILIFSESQTCSQSSGETDFLRRDALLHQSEKQRSRENKAETLTLRYEFKRQNLFFLQRYVKWFSFVYNHSKT